MHEKMHPLLGAYLDGELHGKQLNEMKNHLENCAACQAELHSQEDLKAILHSVPEEACLPPGEFASRLMRRLPRRQVKPHLSRERSRLWWLIPAALIGGWFFIQAVFTVTNLLTAAGTTGLLGQAFAWLGGSQDATWFSAAIMLFGNQVTGQPVLVSFNQISVAGKSLLTGFLWQALIAILYLAWLTSWWRGSRVQADPGIAA